ncbi:MAG TPA: hypothetical protein VJZ99_00810 [Patescibacteria group bacterium]|jgi:photosystem II stability/assembly factor-like uncharacterized protein|nr:hypothetical protein [Patescibacteria group bacterium]
MSKNKLISALFLIFSFVFLSACSINVKTKGGTTLDGGVYVSNNKGDLWRQMPYIPNISGTPNTIASVDVNRLVIDPSDSGAVYLATINDGLYYTYNVARGWNKVLALPSSTTINDVAVDYNNKCIYFVALENKLHKTEDCGRTFVQTYFDNNANVFVSAVAIDHYNSKVVYLGTSRGDVLRSLDGGVSWKAIQRLKNGVRKIVINPRDSRSVFVATSNNGVYKFNAAGGASLEQLEQYRNQFDNTNWTDYNKELKEFSLGINFRDLHFSHQDNSLILATDKAILRSFDEGSSWIKLSLLTPEKDSFINAVAVNPQNSQEILYVTDTSFYRSADGGTTWTVKKLPTSRSGSVLLIDFNNPNIVYLGVKKIKK